MRDEITIQQEALKELSIQPATDPLSTAVEDSDSDTSPRQSRILPELELEYRDLRREFNYVPPPNVRLTSLIVLSPHADSGRCLVQIFPIVIHTQRMKVSRP